MKAAKATMKSSFSPKRPAPKIVAETAIANIPRALSAIMPGIEILLALSPLQPRLTVLVQLIEVRRGRSRASTAQLTLRAGLHATLHTSPPGLRLEVL
jgi:hypothetical protein